jgi:hypothetical protein
MEPEQSTMMISAPDWIPAASAAGVPAVSAAVTVMMALTSCAPSARYSFWSISTVKPG